MKKIIVTLLLLGPLAMFAQTHIFSSITFDLGGVINKFQALPDSVGFNGVFYSSAFRRKLNTVINQVVLIPSQYNDKWSYPGCRQLTDGLKPIKPSFLLFDPSSNVIYSDGGSVPVGGGGATRAIHIDEISSFDTVTGNPVPVQIEYGIEIKGQTKIDTVFTDASPTTVLTIQSGVVKKANFPAVLVPGTDYLPPTGSGASLTGITKTQVGLSALSNTAQVTSVIGTAPILSSGGTTPTISIPAVSSLVDGYLAHADYVNFAGKVSMVFPGVGIPVSSGSAWSSSLIGANGQSLRWISGAARWWPDSLGSGGGAHTIDSIWHTPTGIAYVSTSSFSFNAGSDVIAKMVKGSLCRAVSSNGSVLKVGYITTSINASGIVTCGWVGSADLASGDVIRIAVNQKIDAFTRYITSPQECVADTGYQGMYYLNTKDSLFLLPPDFAVRKAAVGSTTATCTFNIRANYIPLFSVAPDITTARTLVAQRPTTFLIAPGKEIDAIIGASAATGGTPSRAQAFQIRLILVPTPIYRSL